MKLYYVIQAYVSCAGATAGELQAICESFTTFDSACHRAATLVAARVAAE